MPDLATLTLLALTTPLGCALSGPAVAGFAGLTGWLAASAFAPSRRSSASAANDNPPTPRLPAGWANDVATRAG